MKIIQKLSTHFDERKTAIDMIVFHATATKNLEETLWYFIEKEEGGRVSSHYVIDRDGTIYQVIPEEKRAWHAGISSWGDIKEDINSHSIGIEFQCSPTGERSFEEFTRAQINSGLLLCEDLMKRYNIKPENVVAHSDIAPERKFDPGVTFPWEEFVQKGLALNPDRRPFLNENRDNLLTKENDKC
ncbi:MAG: N-acetylmuramoyl-L-alanine amidase [Alphaproteobacteria bacterium]|nr:N-acetylmuramoyl-L-alanine amidase [Alphaproteobacteria bacterium]